MAVPASSLSPEDDDAAAAVTAVAASGIPTTALQLAASVGGGGTCHPPTPLPTVPLPLATASAAVSGGMKWKQVESGLDASSPGTPLPQPLTPNSSKEIAKSQMGGLVRCTRYSLHWLHVNPNSNFWTFRPFLGKFLKEIFS